MTQKLLIAILLFVASCCVNGIEETALQASVYRVQDSLAQSQIGRHFEYLKDETGSLTASEALHMFAAGRGTSQGTNITIGATEDVYWFLASLSGDVSANTNTIICVHHDTIYDLKTWVFESNREVSRHHFSLEAEFHERELQDGAACHTQSIEPGSNYQLLYRADARTHLDFPVYIYRDTEFINTITTSSTRMGLYYGMVILAALYAVALFARTRELYFLYYGAFVASYGLFFAWVHGDAYRYLWPGLPQLNEYGFVVTTTLANLFACLFALDFLQIRTINKPLTNVLRGLVSLHLIILFAGAFLPPAYRAILIGGGSFITYPVFLFAGIASLRSGVRYARFYIVAWAALCLSSSVMGLALLTGQPLFGGWNYIQLASTLELVLLAAAIADRVQTLNMERKRYKEEFRRAEVSAAKLKDDFVSTVTHELLTPINGINLNIEVLKNKDKNLAAELSGIEASSKHLLLLVQAMLTFTEARNEGLSLKTELFDVGQLFRSVTHDTQLSYGRAERIEVLVDPELPRGIRSDPDRIAQMYFELLRNAITHGGEGDVSVRIRIDMDGPQPFLVFSVSDNGTGFTEAQKAEIFDAFKQIDSSSTRAHSGLGLGLTNVKSILLLMHGTLDLESLPGKGTTLTCRVPVQVPAAAAIRSGIPPDEPVSEAAHNTGKLMIVEDNLVNRLLLKEILLLHGFEVLEAENGQEAIVLAEESSDIDAILMDCQMPVKDGYAATRELRKIPRYANMPIIAVTANDSKHDKLRCYESGMNAVLGKPVEIDLLINTINGWTKK